MSTWIIYLTPTINADGILYLLTGNNYLTSSISEAFKTYNWPFFPILFASLSDITTISLLNSAHIISTLGFIMMSYAFIRIVAEMGGDRRVQLIALFIILFQPLYANYRAALVRDPLFLAFMLLALLELIRYSKKQDKRTVAKWLIFSGLSFLARPEALLITALSPVGLLLNRSNSLRENTRVAQGMR